MRQAKVYYKNDLAGWLTEGDEGYEFRYASQYLFSSTPIMDVVNFFEIVLFSWLLGNNDMHLKNFSLWEPVEGSIRLTPAYDLINATLS